jgi:hypothetical protein
MALAYLEVLSGALALLSRAIPKLHPYHVYFGRTFMMVNSSIDLTCLGYVLYQCLFDPHPQHWNAKKHYLLHDFDVLYYDYWYFLFVCQLTLGFGVIRFAQQKFQNDVVKKADEILKQNDGKYTSSASELMDQAVNEMVKTPITWKQRFFSLKSLHGFLMTIAWVIKNY